MVAVQVDHHQVAVLLAHDPAPAAPAHHVQVADLNVLLNLVLPEQAAEALLPWTLKNTVRFRAWVV